MESAKAFFRRIRTYEAQIKALEEQIDNLNSIAMSLGGQHQGVYASAGNHSKIENAVVRLADKKEALSVLINNYVDQINRAEQIIQQVQPAEFQTVLRLYYLSGKNWDEIAKIMKYGKRQLYRIHGYALAKSDEILKRCH